MHITNTFYPSVNRLLDVIHGAPAAGAEAFRVNVRETDAAYLIEADLPGIAKDAVNIDIEDNTLTIDAAYPQARREAENGADKLLRRERPTGKLQRRFLLSRDIDSEAIDAKLDAGVLTLTLPKSAEKRRQITIN